MDLRFGDGGSASRLAEGIEILSSNDADLEWICTIKGNQPSGRMAVGR